MSDETVNDIDYLMSLDPLELSKQNIDQIILYHRNQRALRERGVKPSKDKGPKSTIDLVELGLKPATPKINRRV